MANCPLFDYKRDESIMCIVCTENQNDISRSSRYSKSSTINGILSSTISSTVRRMAIR